MHGGKGSGAPTGTGNGRYHTGLHTKLMKAEMGPIRALIKEAGRFVRDL